MFGKIIPIDTLLQMPLPFVYRLRDMRLKQLEEVNKKMNANNTSNSPAPLIPAGVDHAMFNGTPMDDIIDELTP